MLVAEEHVFRCFAYIRNDYTGVRHVPRYFLLNYRPAPAPERVRAKIFSLRPPRSRSVSLVANCLFEFTTLETRFRERTSRIYNNKFVSDLYD